MNILKIDSSANTDSSRSRELTQLLADKIAELSSGKIIDRDLSKNLSFISNEMLKVFYLPENELSAAEKKTLEPSDIMVNELIESDVIIFGIPMYNFTIPGSLKAYLDQVCRLDKTFATNPTGFSGLLKDKVAFVIICTGGVQVGSQDDFISAYMRKILSFVGIQDVRFLSIDQFDKAKASKQQQDIEQHIADLSLPL